MCQHSPLIANVSFPHAYYELRLAIVSAKLNPSFLELWFGMKSTTIRRTTPLQTLVNTNILTNKSNIRPTLLCGFPYTFSKGKCPIKNFHVGHLKNWRTTCNNWVYWRGLLEFSLVALYIYPSLSKKNYWFSNL